MKTFSRATLVVVGASILPFACVDGGETGLRTTGENEIEPSSAALSVDPSLLAAFEESLRFDILYPYYPAAHDTGYGGFVEDRSSTWGLQQDGDKFITAQARYIWTAAKASQFYSNNAAESAQYQASAAMGFQFLTRMWRGPTLGFYMMADRSGNSGWDSGKEGFVVYGNAFGLYASAAYYALSGDTAALNLAVNAYNYLDDYFYDSQYGGYYLTLSDKRKDTNTNVHMLEALIELYKDLPASHSLRPEVGSRLSQLVARFHDNAIHCPATNDCFAYPVMNQNWTASTSDVSFGHDLELSMLLVEAMTTLGQDPLTSPYIPKIKKVVDFTFAHSGYRSDGGLYYTGTYSSGNVSINDSQLQWWPQAEGLGALCLMRKLFPGDTSYQPLISKSWGFINTQIIDQTRNGWVRQANDWNIGKAWEWHCNYHNGRALMNCLNWVGDGSPTCSDGVQNQGETGVDCGGPCPACQAGSAIWLEAEAGTLSGSPTFATNSDSNASGGQYIQPTANSLNSPGPNRATYTFTVTAGTYKVWGRVISPTADDDSFWVSMDGGSFVKWNSIPLHSSWEWDDVHNSDAGGGAVSYNLTQGSHTLVIANREDGVKLDKLYITALGDIPTGMGGGCTPTTCSDLGAACGTPSDGCGGTLSCGTCPTGQMCSASYQCVCAPTTCAAQGAVCGTISDGCGGTLSCGTCPTGQTCSASNQCICTPTTCAAQGAVCGTISDGCGGTLSCGTCPTGQTCNASNQCVDGTNTAPVVNAGADRTVTLPASLTINGSATDDGLPAPPALSIAWSKSSGPGTVTFNPANAASTTISFSAAGTYVLRLSANDGELSAYDEVQVTVSSGGGNPCDGLCTNPTNFTVNGAYSSGNLGTGVVCRQTTSAVHGGNCGNFASPRTLSVNGTQMACSGGNWSNVPAARNGGYCITTTSGNYAWAFFTVW
jgi:mannobiose 2-epimerase